MSRFQLILSLCLIAYIFPCRSQVLNNKVRTAQKINEHWKYLENPIVDIVEVGKAIGWTDISIPHTWNAEDPTDQEPGYRRNASWYKKQIELPEIDAKSKYSLYFEGANITSVVYVNGIHAGGHVGGYVGFEVDITPYVHPGGNEILIRVDNSYNPEVIPSQKGDFVIYGGITRDVWFLTKPMEYLSALKITTPLVSDTKATLKLMATVENPNHKNTFQQARATLISPKGVEVASKSLKVNGNEIAITFNNIKNPELWDTESPNLYKVKLVLLNQGDVVDEISDRIGFRWFEFKDYGPFYLNGKRLLLRGTHRHEEIAGLGAAMSNAQHRKDMEDIKEMGANFVRLAHYPQDPEVYRACDELGLLVWDELPWCRGGMGGQVWQTNTKNLLKEMIDQNYNHPSIIIWSLGNELYWLPDFEGGDDPMKLNAFLEELNTIAHTLDPFRKTAMRKYYDGAAIVDVFSPSIWSGWYSGNYKGYQKALKINKEKCKHFLHAEYGGSSHVGRHTGNPITGGGTIPSDGWEEAAVQTEVTNIAQIGDWSENYIVDLFDWYLRISETDPTFVGNAQWAFNDFATPLRPGNAIPYMNQKGLRDRNRNPKDAYYVFKSYWAKKPFVYIESHTWTERQGPEGLTRNLSIFSNCQTVTLYHNGQNLGAKIKDIHSFPASGLNWDVDFQEGKNKLIAVGKTQSGEEVRDTIEVNYRYKKNETAQGLSLTFQKLENGNYLVTAIAGDRDGLRCLDYEDKVYFQCLSGGRTMKNQGTPTGSEVIAMANGKASIEVVPDKASKKIVVMVLNQNFKGTFLEIEP